MRWRYLALAAALAHPCGAADAPTVRPLDSGETPPNATSEPARTLPPTVAVCHDPAAQRCWTAPLAEDCAREKGLVFRVVLGDANGRDAVAAIKQCHTAAAQGR